MKRKQWSLAPFGVLAVADGFFCKFAAFPFRRTLQHQHDRVRGGTGASVLAEEGTDGDSRIDADSDALEEWVSRMGGAIGPVVLEGRLLGTR